MKNTSTFTVKLKVTVDHIGLSDDAVKKLLIDALDESMPSVPYHSDDAEIIVIKWEYT